jgi:hypothetical protein
MMKMAMKSRRKLNMNAEQVGGMIRAILAALGGYFVNKGIIDNSILTAVLGAVGPIVAAIWSVWLKK